MNTIQVLLLAFSAILNAPDPQVAGTRPKALVFEHIDQWTHSAEAEKRLKDAGFQVSSLPLDESPEPMDATMILIGSFASEHPKYSEYMSKYSDALLRYVERGHLLVQFTQTDQVESKPPFVKDPLTLKRNDQDFGTVVVRESEHPLVRGFTSRNGSIQFSKTRTAWECFSDQSGFEVILAADEHANHPVLVECTHGNGRLVFAAMALDKEAFGRDADGEYREQFESVRQGFFHNLALHALSIQQETAPPTKVTPSPLTPLVHVKDSWTIALLPDTQLYSLRHPGMFIAQTGWVALNKDRLDIRYVLHLGDIVNNNSSMEWENARDAMSLLDGIVPYALVPGNHDYGPSGSGSTRDTLLNHFFEFKKYQADHPSLGKTMEDLKLDNTYHLFEGGGRSWIIIALEWGPRDSTIEWADQVMEEHSDRFGILITHAYMNNNDLRYDHTDNVNSQQYNPHHYKTEGGVNDGRELWEKLVRKHRFLFTLNGHVLGDGTGYRVDKTDTGTSCHQMLVNYQMRNLGGEAYLRLLEFHPDGKTVQVKSYSPIYDKYLLQPDQQFVLTLEDGTLK